MLTNKTSHAQKAPYQENGAFKFRKNIDKHNHGTTKIKGPSGETKTKKKKRKWKKDTTEIENEK